MKRFAAAMACAASIAAIPFAAAQGQRQGLQPDSLHLLIRATDYTFHKICENYLNPDMYFDELALYRDIAAITNDLSMYMWGSSIDDGTGEEIHALPFTGHEERLNRPHPNRPFNRPYFVDVERENYQVNIQQHPSRRPFGRSRIPKASPAVPSINCAKFEKDLRHFSESFQNMSYAISEKCYRQCQPQGYVTYATTSLQAAFERHYNGGFYAQVREIEAQTGCRFDDTFMIESERAIDYSKIWISTFQSFEKPCAGLSKSKSNTRWA